MLRTIKLYLVTAGLVILAGFLAWNQVHKEIIISDPNADPGSLRCPTGLVKDRFLFDQINGTRLTCTESHLLWIDQNFTTVMIFIFAGMALITGILIYLEPITRARYLAKILWKAPVSR
ncbi:hypothetical protein KBC99_02050 [Candidatus Saccharibacteria bacterium]|nr:hypothetical protein [Candidatus Saccharibacteria bacterium]